MGNDLTKYYCTAALYNLSLRHVLTREPGFITGLVELTSYHYSARQLLCAKIFANGTYGLASSEQARENLGQGPHRLSLLSCLGCTSASTASMNSKGRNAIGNNLAVLICLCRMLRSTCKGESATPGHKQALGSFLRAFNKVTSSL